MKNSALLLVLTAVAVLVAAPAKAQDVGTGQCESFGAGGRTTVNRTLGVTWMGGGAFFQCPGGVTIRSDSAEITESLGLARFIGSVRYADSTRVLTADWVEYQRDQAQITARGNVTLRDAGSGATISDAPEMMYYQATETRPDGLIVIPRGRPVAVLVRAGVDGAPADTTRIVSDQLNIYGDDRFLARGDVVITRADVTATASEAEYGGESSELRLHGHARLVGEEYELSADTIVALTDEADRLREVVAHGSGELDSTEQDFQVIAPVIRIELSDGEVDRLVAVVPAELRGAPAGAPPVDEAGDPAGEPAIAATEPLRARAVSADFTVLADSIDATTPGRRLERVIAVGRAYAERLDADSIRAGLPDVIAKDWVRGDTVVATFAAGTDEADAEERVIEQITAIGAEQSPASALAMVRNDSQAADDPESRGRPGFSYQIARWIQIRFAAGEIDVVEVDGLRQGLYTQPEEAARAVGSRTAQAGGGR